MFCVHCGKELLPDSNFCNHCGKGLYIEFKKKVPKGSFLMKMMSVYSLYFALPAFILIAIAFIDFLISGRPGDYERASKNMLIIFSTIASIIGLTLGVFGIIKARKLKKMNLKTTFSFFGSLVGGIGSMLCLLLNILYIIIV